MKTALGDHAVDARRRVREQQRVSGLRCRLSPVNADTGLPGPLACPRAVGWRRGSSKGDPGRPSPGPRRRRSRGSPKIQTRDRISEVRAHPQFGGGLEARPRRTCPDAEPATRLSEVASRRQAAGEGESGCAGFRGAGPPCRRSRADIACRRACSPGRGQIHAKRRLVTRDCQHGRVRIHRVRCVAPRLNPAVAPVSGIADASVCGNFFEVL